jgi:soluble lytic murein transglycosylase
LASTCKAVGKKTKRNRLALTALGIGLLAVGCDGADRGASTPSGAARALPSDGAALAPDSPQPSMEAEGSVPLATAWAETVRRQRWAEAAAQIDALPPVEQNKPEVQYARAHVALAMNDAKLALARLGGLEQGLPLLAADIQRSRAEAQVIAGPFADAAAYFGAHSSPDAMIKAAEAYERASEPVRARTQCERLLSNEHRTRLQEARARMVRSRLAEAEGNRTTSVADARWVAVHAPDSSSGRDADAALGRLAPDRPLSAEELMKRARAWADAGRTDDALHALDRVASAAGPKVTRLEELRERADILYKTRGRSLEAARFLDECAATGGPHAVEDDFHAARALARADKDDDAINRMALIARHHPNTTWGDEAQYFVPYLHLLHGDWKVAAAGFDEYAEKYPNGVERHEALRNRAIAHLMNQNNATARTLFERVAAQESDPLAAARALTMAALGSMRDGDHLHAVARWSDVARSYPLSWPALVARTRLAEVGAPVPPAIESGTPAPGFEPSPVALPPSVELLHRIGLDGDAENALEERENVVTSHAPVGRSLEALCTAYGKLGRAKRRFQITKQIPGEALASAPNAATRWAWECAYPEPYADAVFAGAGAAVGAVSLVYSVMRQESNFDPDAVSPAHAVGLMQLLPETARTLASASGLSFDDSRLSVPELNIGLGGRYLQDLRLRFDDRLALAVAAYNGGEDAITRWLGRAPGMDLDVFIERIPFAETRAYVARVMGNFARYEYLKKGEAGVPTVALALKSP